MKYLIFLCILLTACSSFEKLNAPVLLDQHSQFYLQAVPKDLWGQASLQKLLITTPQDKHELLLQTELRPNQIAMVGLTTAGVVLFKLTWSNEVGLKVNTNILAKKIDPQIMLAYFQLASWPIENIQLGLKNLHIALASEDKQKRNFYRGEKRVFSIEQTSQHSLMTHYIDHYQIEIETLQQSKIEY